MSALALLRVITARVSRELARGVCMTFAASLCLYAAVVMLVNSQWGDPLFNRLVNPKFSGEIRWERAAWGPRPWNITLKQVRLIDASDFEVITAEQMQVRDYLLAGLSEDTFGARSIDLYGGRVALIHRPHTSAPQRLVWNISELFQPRDFISKLKDGDPKPPVLVQVEHVNLHHTLASISMGVTQVDARDVSVERGFFEIDLTRDIMRIRASSLRAGMVNTQVFLRQRTPEMTPLEKANAPLVRTLDYRGSMLKGRSFWWLKDQFGSSDLSLKLYQQDSLTLRDWILDLAPLGVPHGRAFVSAEINDLSRYIEPWSLDRWVKGELKVSGEINGPLSNLSARKLSAEGQVFIPVMGGVRFQLDGHKQRDGLIEVSRGRIWSILGDLGLKATLDVPRRLGSAHLVAHELIWSSIAPLPPAWRAWEKSATGEISLRLRPELSEVALFAPSDTPQWSLGIDVNLHARGPKQVTLKSRAELTPQALTLNQSELTLRRLTDRRDARPRQRITARGAFNFVKKTIQGNLRLFGAVGPASLPPLKLPVSARLKLNMSVAGSLSRPRVSGNVNAQKIISYLGNYQRQFKELNARFSYKDDELHLSKSVLKSRDGSARFELHLPLKRPQDVSGWARLKSFVVDLDSELSPLGIPMSGRFEGLLCSTNERGCERYKTQFTRTSNQVRGSCLESIYLSEQKDQRGAEACLFIQRIRVGGADLGELDLDASLSSRSLKVRRGRYKVDDDLFVELQGQLDNPLSRQRRLSASLQFRSELSLARRFINNPPPVLRYLKGTLRGDLDLAGPLDRLEGKGEVKLWRLHTALTDPPLKRESATLPQIAPLQVNLGASQLSLKMERQVITLTGHIGRQLWLNGEYQLKPAELNLNIDFPRLAFTLLSAPSDGSKSVESELRALLSSLHIPRKEDPDTPPRQSSLDSLLLSQSPQRYNFLTLSSAEMCHWLTFPLPTSQTLNLSSQGSLNLSWSLTSGRGPQLNLTLDQAHINYWMRDLKGDILSGESSCESLCPNQRIRRCPTARFSVQEKNHVEVLSVESLADHIWINPKRTLASSSKSHRASKPAVAKDRTSPTSRAESPTSPTATSASLPRCRVTIPGVTSREVITLQPLKISQSQSLKRDGGSRLQGLRAPQDLEIELSLVKGQVAGCVRGGLDLRLLSPILRGIAQQTNGEIELESRLSGYLDTLQLSGYLRLKSAEMLSPRVRVIGDLSLKEPALLQLHQVKGGGTQLSLAPHETLKIQRDDELILFNELSANLPRFNLQRLSAGFSASQLDLMMPPALRASLSLDAMRFEMVNHLPAAPSASGQDHETTASRPSGYARAAPPTLKLSGDVKVLRGTYQASFLSLEELLYQGGVNAVAGRKTVDSLSIFETLPLLQDFHLNVNIQGDDEVTFKSQVADIATLDFELRLNLKVRGRIFSRPGDPLEERLQLGGAVEALSGSTLTISTNPFEVDYAKVLFGGDVGQESQTSEFIFADLVARHVFQIPANVNQGRQINFDQKLNTDLVDEEVMLTGQFKMASSESVPKINFDLSSQSGRDRFEVLSLVLFGSYPNGPNGPGGAQPTGLLISPILNFIERPLADSFGLDKLSLTPDSGGLAIDINKIFSPRLRLNLRAQVGEIDPNNPQTVFLEYKINNQVSAEATAERQGDVNPGSGRVRLRLRLSWD